MDLINPNDYDLILKHYNMRIPNSPLLKKAAVEEVLATKMCKCIKAVQEGSKLDEPAAIAICNKSIFRNRGLKYNRIACKKKYEFIKGKKSGIPSSSSRRGNSSIADSDNIFFKRLHKLSYYNNIQF